MQQSNHTLTSTLSVLRFTTKTKQRQGCRHTAHSAAAAERSAFLLYNRENWYAKQQAGKQALDEPTEVQDVSK
jgi:hypothetical protein